MDQDAVTMLENLYAFFIEKFKNKALAWERLLEFLAVDNQAKIFWQVNHKFEYLWEDQDFTKKVMGAYDSEVLRNEKKDVLTDFYNSKVRPKTLGILQSVTMNNLTLHKISCQAFLEYCEANKPNRSYAITNDLQLYRILVTNLAIHDLPGKILLMPVGHYVLDITFPDGKFNWQFANHWHPEPKLLRKLQMGEVA